LASIILNIPATSAPSEQVLTKAGLLPSPKIELDCISDCKGTDFLHEVIPAIESCEGRN
jgi:hypothetical protein